MSKKPNIGELAKNLDEDRFYSRSEIANMAKQYGLSLLRTSFATVTNTSEFGTPIKRLPLFPMGPFGVVLDAPGPDRFPFLYYPGSGYKSQGHRQYTGFATLF